MAKNSVEDWDYVPGNNTDISGIGILGTSPPSNFDNALRTLMSQTKAGINTGVRTKLYMEDISVTANNVRINPEPAITSYVDGQTFLVKVANTNSGSSSLNVSSLGSVALRYVDGPELEAGDIHVGDIIMVTCRGGTFIMPSKMTAVVGRRGLVAMASLADTAAGTKTGVAVSPSTFQGSVHTSLYEADISASANNVIINPVPALAAYADGQEFLVKVANTCTGAMSINISGLSSVDLIYMDGTAVPSADVQAGETLHIVGLNGGFRIVGRNTAVVGRRGLVALANSAGTITGTNSSTAVTPQGYRAGLLNVGGKLFFAGVAGTGAYAFTPSSNGLIAGDKIRFTGIGGGGGAGPSSGSYGSAGAGGGRVEKVITIVDPNATVTITIGAGGAGQLSGADGIAGGTTSYGSVCSATGGLGGSSSPTGGGTGVGGDVNMVGSSGGDISTLLQFAAGGAAPGMGSANVITSSLINPFGSGGACFNNGTATAGNGMPGCAWVEW